MDAVEYLKARHRLCSYHSRNNCTCEGCPLGATFGTCFPHQTERDDPEKAVNNVEGWAKSHPLRTRQSVFLERYPDAETLGNGVLRICPKLIERVECIYSGDDGFTDCTTCLCKYWHQEIDGDE